MSDERTFRPRRSSLFANLFSHNPKNNVHIKDEEETMNEMKKSDEKRRSLQDSKEALMISYQERYSRRSQSVSIPKSVRIPKSVSMTIPAVSHGKQLQNYEKAMRKSFDMEDQIIKAKHEARTVSVIDGNLYIDYRYIGPIGRPV